MSHLPGNPHYEASTNLSGAVHDWQAEEGATDATMQAVALDALTEATLALAYEQHTANLIAAQMRGPVDVSEWPREVIDLWWRQQEFIAARLGMDAK